MAFFLFADPIQVGSVLVEQEVPRGWISHPYKKTWLDKPGQTAQNLFCDLRRPGGHSHFCDFRPMALRLRLSPDLPLSDVALYHQYITLWPLKPCSELAKFLS